MPATAFDLTPPATAARPQFRDAAALAFQRRVQLVDRLARTAIAVSGIAIIAAVLGIGLFLLLEILPLFRGAQVSPTFTQPVLGADDRPLAVLVDEHQERAAVVGTEPLLRVAQLDRRTAPQAIPIPWLEGRRLSAVSRVLHSPTLALGTTTGQVWVGAIALSTVFEGSARTIQVSVEPEAVIEAVPGSRISRLAYRAAGARSLVAAVADDTHVVLTRIATSRPLIGPVRRMLESLPVALEGIGPPSALLIRESCDEFLVGTTEGWLARYRVPAEGGVELLETARVVPHGGVSAMAYLLGDRSVAVGGSDGSVATWSLLRDARQADGWRLTRIHPFPGSAAPVTAIAASPRDKGFLTISEDGLGRLHYMTSERTLATLAMGGRAAAAEFAPKANGAFVVTDDGVLHGWAIRNPHPEVSWRAFFGALWYEGYPAPDFIWQSTGGTDDFEPKFSLVPLVFGTLKGTCYALLFAIPLALFGALYCSQFLDKRLRAPVKSAIELMAALPSVVLGFVTGVVMAPLVQHRIVAVLASPLVVPLVCLGVMAACASCPWPAVRGAVRRHEFWVLVAAVFLGALAAGWLAPGIERWCFGGDFEAWLLKTAGIRYDQRNALVVGWAMGFAVIPIIFTICEDAFSAVPNHLVGASLACGASLWQTAWRVVLPAAGSGVFSAVMVGFGRAIGETMIVLMATGNTPVMDWSAFNGFRALSANIAVEISEAPYGGTLYRVLFVAALLLFAMTFVVNTVAELVRLRLRRRLQGL